MLSALGSLSKLYAPNNTIVIYECESWTIKKAKCQRIGAFKLRRWRRLLRVPWIARRWNQSILEEINPEYSLEVLMLKLKLRYVGHPMQRGNSLEKTLILGKTKGKRRRGWQRMRCLGGITESLDMSLSKLGDSEGQGSLACWSPWGCKELDITLWLNSSNNLLLFLSLNPFCDYTSRPSLFPGSSGMENLIKNSIL